MPRIPTNERAGLIEQQPPGASIPVQSFGNAGESTAHFGNQLAQAGIQMAVKIKESDDRNFANQQFIQDKIDIERYSQELRLQAPEDGSGYSQGMQKYLDDKFQVSQKLAPSNSAKQQYVEMAKRPFAGEMIESNNYEFVAKQKFKLQKNIDLINESARHYTSFPDAQKALAQIQALESHVHQGIGTDYDEKTANELIRKMMPNIVEGTFSGMLAQRRYNEGLALLKGGEQGDAAITKYLDPEKKAILTRQFMSARESLMKEEVSDIKYQAGQMELTALSGADVDQGRVNLMIKKLQGMPADVIDPVRKDEQIDSLNMLSKVSGAMKLMQERPMNEWDNFDPKLQGPDSSGFNAQDRLRFKNNFQNQKQFLKKQLHDDPASFLINKEPSIELSFQAIQDGNQGAIQKYVSEIRSKQEVMGVPDAWQRVIPKSYSQQIAAQFNESKNPVAIAKSMSDMQKSWGSNYQRLWSDLIRDNKDMGKFGVAALMADPAVRADVISNIMKRESINKAFKEQAGTSGKDDLSARLTQNDDYQNFKAALLSTDDQLGNLPLINSFEEEISSDIKAQVISSDSKIASNAMVKNSVNKIVNRHFSNVVAGKTNLLVPKQYNADAVDRYVNDLQASFRSTLLGKQAVELGGGRGMKVVEPDRKLIDELNLFIPPNIKEQDYFEFLHKNSGWVVNKAMDGMMFVQKHPHDGIRPISDKNGHPIVLKFDDVSLGRSK